MSSVRPRRQAAPTAAESEVLRARAALLLRARDEGSEGQDQVWLAELTVGDTRYALPLEQLRAAVPLRRVTPVPLARPEVVGILRFEGAVITAFSFAALLGARGWRRDSAVLLVVELQGGRRVALDCEEPPRPLSLPAQAVQGARGDGPVRDLVLTDHQTLHVVNLERLLAAVVGGADGS